MKRNASKLELGPDSISEQITATKSHNLGEVQEVKVGMHHHGIATTLVDIKCIERVFTLHDFLYDYCSYGYMGGIFKVHDCLAVLQKTAIK
jgi:hypothetical protein